jgi:hypothetical protein
MPRDIEQEISSTPDSTLLRNDASEVEIRELAGQLARKSVGSAEAVRKSRLQKLRRQSLG